MAISITRPLPARMRPRSLDEVVGQKRLLGKGGVLRSIAASAGHVPSVILWGPPGTGKTSIAQAIALETSHRFAELSATSASVKDVREVISAAEAAAEGGERTLLFLDEIHRFTKAQQDVLLHAVEEGVLALIGATTENPNFSVINALNSRSVLLTLDPLSDDDLMELLRRAVSEERGLDGAVAFDDEALAAIARSASGDARQSLTLLETVASVAQAGGRSDVDLAFVAEVAPASIARYDRDGDQHYDIVSAFIKSMRGSDPDAAVYWLGRMIEAGEDPRFIARRIMVHAAEDVGLADPMALVVATSAAQATQLIGMPEARIILSEAALYVATAPKSPASYRAIGDALAAIAAGARHEVPMHLRDSHYPGAAALGHGAGYLYPHDYPKSVVEQQYLPQELAGASFYAPRRSGHEASVADRLEAIQKIERLRRESE